MEPENLEPGGSNSTLEIESGADASKATFTLTNEDHTLGNAVRYILAKKCARRALAPRARVACSLTERARAFAPRAAEQSAGLVRGLQRAAPV